MQSCAAGCRISMHSQEKGAVLRSPYRLLWCFPLSGTPTRTLTIGTGRLLTLAVFLSIPPSTPLCSTLRPGYVVGCISRSTAYSDRDFRPLCHVVSCLRGATEEEQPSREMSTNSCTSVHCHECGRLDAQRLLAVEHSLKQETAVR